VSVTIFKIIFYKRIENLSKISRKVPKRLEAFGIQLKKCQLLVLILNLLEDHQVKRELPGI
jgi:hypothetical protein